MIRFMWFERYHFHSSKREIVTTSCTMGKELSAFSRCVGTILGSWVKRLIVPDLHCPPQTREYCSTRMTLININLLLVNCTRIGHLCLTSSWQCCCQVKQTQFYRRCKLPCLQEQWGFSWEKCQRLWQWKHGTTAVSPTQSANGLGKKMICCRCHCSIIIK